MRFAFYALTDFQLFNILKFVMADCEHSREAGDLYLGDNLKEVARKKEALLALNLFSHVYIVHTLAYPSNKYIRKLTTSVRSMNRGLLGKLIDEECAAEIFGRQYDVAVVACAALQFQVFWNYFRPKEIFLIEDGTGSYSGDINQATISRMRLMLSRLMGYSPRFTKMYVNSASFCRSTMQLEICEIPQPEPDSFETAALTVFQNNQFHETYRPRDVIYLEQPVDAAETELIQRQRATLALLSEIYGDRLIVRRHPGMKNEKKGDYRYDTDYDMWELVAAKQISRENILIGEYSTAQITPKLLFGKEPYVVFLYRLFKPEATSKLNQTYQDFCALYSDPRRISAPSTLEELQRCLREIP